MHCQSKDIKTGIKVDEGEQQQISQRVKFVLRGSVAAHWLGVSTSRLVGFLVEFSRTQG